MKKSITFPKILFIVGSVLIFTASSSMKLSEADDPPFYLSNYTTFFPGDEVIINLYSDSKVNHNFTLRLLKVDDVVRFFTELDENRRSYNFDVWNAENELLLKYTSLVKKWKEKVGTHSYYKNLKIGKIEQSGIYLLQVSDRKSVAYCPIVVTDKTIIIKTTAKQILALVSDVKSGEITTKVRFKIFQGKKLIFDAKSNNDGILFTNYANDNNSAKGKLLFAEVKDEIVVFNPYWFFGRGDPSKLLAYIYTNQPVYRPGQRVNFKAIFREINKNELLNLAEKTAKVTIKTSKNKEVYSAEIKTNEFGTISAGFYLDEDADLGVYSIFIEMDGKNFYGSFSVEEYKKPEYKVNISLNQNQYSAGEEIKGTVSADYYFGSPVQNAQVKVMIYRETFWRPWWYFSEYRWFYRNFEKWNPYYTYNKELIHELSGELGADGKYHFNYPLQEKAENDFKYSVVAIVTDASRRSTEGSTQFFVTRGAFSLSTSPEKYFFDINSEVRLRINAFDFDDKPVKTSFYVVINYPYDKLMRPGQISDTVKGYTNENGNAFISYRPKVNLEGQYTYKVVATDQKGREISASSSFYYGNYKYYYYDRTSSGIEIVTDKDAYDKGETLRAVVFVPFENQDLLLTYEADEILYYKKIKTEGNSFEINEKLTDKFSPSFNVSVTFYRDKIMYNNSKLIGVLAKDKFLNIELSSSQKIYKPGEKAFYDLLVKDYKGNPVKNTELSFGIVDESIYAIKEEQTTPIQNFFYSPRSEHIPIYNSQNSHRFGMRSRMASFLELYYFNSEGEAYEPTNIKSVKLFGKVTAQKSDIDLKEYKVMIISDKKKYESRIDSTGNYSFRDVKAGKYQLYLVKMNGGMAFIDVLYLNKNTERNIDLDSTVLESLNEVLVTAERFDVPEMSINTLKMTVSDGNQPLDINGLRSKEMMYEEKDKSDYVQPDVRSNFVDALIWRANVITDSNGKARIEFKVPDNLTTWRTIVRGVTKETAVGEKVDKFMARKDLLIRMETPRFFREGDEVVISTIVHNYLATPKKTKIEFSSEQLTLLGSAINTKSFGSNFSGRKFYEVEIAENSELRIDWICKVNFPLGEAVLKAQALTNEESDALELKVPILPNGIKVVNPIVADYSDKNVNETEEFEIPADIDLRTAKIRFSISPSLAGTLLKALDDLAGYPYGCVEQTMSRFLPTVIVAKTFRELSIPLKSKTIEELPKYVEAGLKRLYDFQHSDGGWGWWTNDNTNPYMTAYVIYGLTIAKEAGYKIDESKYQTGLRNLRNNIEKADPNIDETTLSFMIYSLSYALKEMDYQKTLYYQTVDVLLRKDLNTYPLALLSLALNNFGQKDKSVKVAERILKNVTEESSFAYWGSENSSNFRWQNDNVQSTAFALKAITNSKGDSELLSKVVRWLLKRKQGYSWRSTQETATVIFALIDYIKITKELNPDFSIKVYLNQKEVFSKKITDKDINNELTEISFDGLKDNILIKGKNKIRIEKSGVGKIYFAGINEYFKADINSVSNENGFKVRREYYILKPKQKDDKIIYVKEKFNGVIESGKELFVKTYVESKGSDLEYFILEDMLPSGFEVMKDLDRYVIEGEGDYYDYDYPHYRPWRWHYADREYRDEKVAFFVTNCSNKMEFSYIIKAQIPGEYKIMPSQAYLMYYPEMNGFSEIVNVRVEDIK